MPVNQMQLSRKVDAEIREEHQVAMLEVDRFFRMKMLLIVRLALPLQKHISNPEQAELKQAEISVIRTQDTVHTTATA